MAINDRKESYGGYGLERRLITIRQAKFEDIPKIMMFIDEHWRKGDALAKNRQFFEWSFVKNGNVTMAIAIDEVQGIIYGMNAYMPYTDDDNPDCYRTIWKAIKCEDPLLGIHIAEYVNKNICCRYQAGTGLRGPAIRYAKMCNRPVVIMDHYYRLNPNLKPEDFRIASVVECPVRTSKKGKVFFESINSMDDFKSVIPENLLKERVFRKDYKYIKWRFFEHPIYKYDMWRVYGSDINSEAVLITREEKLDDSKACKIVDYYGPQEAYGFIGPLLDDIMNQNGYEYCDIYSYGIPTEHYENAGMIRCDKESKNIIPNYFQPFLRENIDILMLKPSFEGLVLYRADGDQDRPCQ